MCQHCLRYFDATRTGQRSRLGWVCGECLEQINALLDEDAGR